MSGSHSTAPLIMLIRHGEKPSGSRHGVNSKGKRENGSLTVRGWQRAGALACLLARQHDFEGASLLARPQFIFAPKSEEPGESKRCLQTVTPLAKKLGIRVNTAFPKYGFTEMVNVATSLGGVVLICWQREYLREIADLILDDETTAPRDWDKERFDLVWIFERDFVSSRYHFTQFPQNLLKNDSNEP